MPASRKPRPDPNLPRPDATGPAPELVWPASLAAPAQPPALVYLDLNHWIQLAKASIGHRDGNRYRDLLDSLRVAKSSNVAIFPLSATHAYEIGMISDPRQRADVASIMEELSSFATLLSRPTMMRIEARASIEAAVGPLYPAPQPQLLVDRNLMRAFGQESFRLLIRDTDGNDVTSELRDQVGHTKFDEMMSEANLMLWRSLLAGPNDSEVQELRQHGYAPEKARQISERRVQQERDFSNYLDLENPGLRRGRLRDAVGARELMIELVDIITEALIPHRLTLGDIAQEDRSKIRAFARGMPSCEVAIELKTQYHRNREKVWQVNDIHDIDALALAVPYCDIVYTDAAARDALEKAALDRRMNTALPRTPQDLVELLARLSA